MNRTGAGTSTGAGTNASTTGVNPDQHTPPFYLSTLDSHKYTYRFAGLSTEINYRWKLPEKFHLAFEKYFDRV